MFFFHSMFSLKLIALVSGAALLIYIKNQNKIKSAWLTFIAWFVMILSALAILGSIFFGLYFWTEGYEMFSHKMHRMQDQRNMMPQESQQMDQNRMQPSPMMRGK